MEPITTAALIGAGSNIISGLFGRKNSEDNAQAQRDVNAANLAWAREQQARNESLQREFAQTGVRWKVEDAKAAGLHPLYAMGANTTSFSPIAVGANQQAPHKENWAGDTFARMGQDLSKAVALQQSPEEKAATRLNLELMHAKVLREYAEIDALRSNASAHTNVAMSYPVSSAGALREVPLVVQATNGRVMGNEQVGGPPQRSGQFKVEPQKVPTHSKANAGLLPRPTPGYIVTTQPDGSEILMPAQGDQRMDEISALDFWPWLRANLAANSNFIGDYFLGPEMNTRLSWPNVKRAISSSWRTPYQRAQDFRR